MRSSRMFEIIQLLRSAENPLRAQDIAEVLEVTTRTIYRDIVSLQAARVPIDGAAGIGYVLRSGYDLPPINFDIEEAEAISVGLSMIARTGDKGLEKAAQRVANKLSEATHLSAALYSTNWGPEPPHHVDLTEIRAAIRDEAKLKLNYSDEADNQTGRIILPIALVYYSESVVLVGWCELRQDFRHFRSDRIQSNTVLAERFLGQGDRLREEWVAEGNTVF